MLSKDGMRKAQAYPLRYGEHFCHSYSLCDMYPVLHTVSILPHCSDIFARSLRLSAKKNRLI